MSVHTDIPALLVTKGKSLYSLYGISPTVLGSTTYSQERPSEKDAKIQTSEGISSWGMNNLFPQDIVIKMAKCSLAMSALKFRIDAHYGKGLLVYKEEVVGESKIRKVPILDHPGWTAFCKKNQIPKLQAGLISDWEWFRNIFGVEIILSNDGKSINRVYRRPATQCRWKKRKDGKNISEIVIRGDWGTADQGDKKDITLDVLDIDRPIEDLRERIAKGSTKRNFFLPFRLEDFGNTYYDFPYWLSILDTWIPIADNVARAKNALLSNQMALKFHIKIPFSYWPAKYKDWASLTPRDQLEKINEFTKAMDAHLSDTENYGKSLVSHYGIDPVNPALGKIEEVKIEAIDNTKMKDGANIIDGQAANAEILTALGVDPALLGGILPGGKEAGSGSNKREALQIHLAKLGIDTAVTTFWVSLVWEYNGWMKDSETIQAGYRYIDSSQTLSENPTGSKEIL